MDLKDFIANTELVAVPAGISADAGPESAEDDLQATVDAGSVLGFVDGLSRPGQGRCPVFHPV